MGQFPQAEEHYPGHIRGFAKIERFAATGKQHG
jgi:hypothetical protein